MFAHAHPIEVVQAVWAIVGLICNIWCIALALLDRRFVRKSGTNGALLLGVWSGIRDACAFFCIQFPLVWIGFYSMITAPPPPKLTEEQFMSHIIMIFITTGLSVLAMLRMHDVTQIVRFYDPLNKTALEEIKSDTAAAKEDIAITKEDVAITKEDVAIIKDNVVPSPGPKA